jgi:hypothetical protein
MCPVVVRGVPSAVPLGSRASSMICQAVNFYVKILNLIDNLLIDELLLWHKFLLTAHNSFSHLLHVGFWWHILLKWPMSEALVGFVEILAWVLW